MKALVGACERRPVRLLAEVAALRGRVRELEQALGDAQQENEALRAALREREDLEIALPVG